MLRRTAQGAGRGLTPAPCAPLATATPRARRRAVCVAAEWLGIDFTAGRVSRRWGGRSAQVGRMHCAQARQRRAGLLDNATRRVGMLFAPGTRAVSQTATVLDLSSSRPSRSRRRLRGSTARRCSCSGEVLPGVWPRRAWCAWQRSVGRRRAPQTPTQWESLSSALFGIIWRATKPTCSGAAPPSTGTRAARLY